MANVHDHESLRRRVASMSHANSLIAPYWPDNFFQSLIYSMVIPKLPLMIVRAYAKAMNGPEQKEQSFRYLFRFMNLLLRERM